MSLIKVGDKVTALGGGEFDHRGGQEGVVTDIIRHLPVGKTKAHMVYRVEFPKKVRVGDTQVNDWDWFRKHQLLLR